VSEKRNPEDIPPGLLARADQLQANADEHGAEIQALMDEASDDAREAAAAGDRPLDFDEMAALAQAQQRLEETTTVEDVGG
jgi:hypothetical protein